MQNRKMMDLMVLENTGLEIHRSNDLPTSVTSTFQADRRRAGFKLEVSRLNLFMLIRYPQKATIDYINEWLVKSTD